MNFNYNMSKKYMNKLETQIKDLQERIDKATKYISENMNSNSVSMLTSGKSTDIGYCIPVFEDLLDILKGSDKE